MTTKTFCFDFRLNIAVLLAIGLALAGGVARAQTAGTYTDQHDFGGTVTNAGGTSGADGSHPFCTVTLDRLGDMYGTTTYGGPYHGAYVDGGGMVWEVTAAGLYKDLHDFGNTVTNADGVTGPDGSYPSVAPVTFDSSGNMYGTTSEGGPYGQGIVWELTTGGTYKDLHDFGATTVNANNTVGPDGSYPSAAGVTFDQHGNLYGTTYEGGANGSTNGGPVVGMVWEITATGSYKDLHDFGATVVNSVGASVPDGAGPSAGVTVDSSGDLYGTTQNGGANDPSDFGGSARGGIVWEMTPAGTYTILHNFGGTVTLASGTSGQDGWSPFSGVTKDSSGNLYGAASDDNASPGGMIWKITAAGAYVDLHDFGATITDASGARGPDGSDPVSPITLDDAGNLYGTALFGGGLNAGMAWELTTAGSYTDLRDFGGTVTNASGVSGSDGSDPWGGIAFDSAGNMVGTTAQGGANRAGLLWKIALPAAPSPTVSPNGGTFTSPQSATISDSLAAASIYYTTNGATPTTASSLYTGPITVSSSETITAIAVAAGYVNSAPTVAAFTINASTPSTAPTPVISPSGGTFTSTQSVTIADSLSSALIYYTTDGSTPTTSSSLYSGAVSVSASETLSAIAVATGYTNSAVASAYFIINPAAVPTPTPTIGPDGGTFTSAQSVQIHDIIPSAAIYYTTDGSTPTPNSSLYSGAITVSFSETINAIAIATGYLSSAVSSAAFTITLPVQGVYTDIHDFGGILTTSSGSITDGMGPEASITADSAGDFYGTTNTGGANHDGLVWELTAAGTYKDLHDFGGAVTNASGASGTDGIGPSAGVTFDTAGNIYGTTTAGGPNYNQSITTSFTGGVVWEITAAGTYKDLHDFGAVVTNASGASGEDGAGPEAAVTFDTAGDLVGTTYQGGANGDGMVWEITAAGTYRDLHDFGGGVTNAGGSTGPDGAFPDAGVTFDTAGNMYGTTLGGGPNIVSGSQSGSGMVWEITAAGTYLDLHDFGGTVPNHSGSISPDGIKPAAGVTFDTAGNLYGTTEAGGANGGGMVWELTAAGTYEELHFFGGTAVDANGTNGPDGSAPQAGVSFDSAGNLYGTAGDGGPNGDNQLGDGMIWEITVAATYVDLHDFGGLATNTSGTSGPDGIGPVAGVSFDSAGNMYGTAYSAGAHSDGMAWELAVPTAPTPAISPNGGSFSTVQTVTITDALTTALIFYTTDGSTPTTSSLRYSGPISVSSSETISAIAVSAGYRNSAVASAAFNIYLNGSILASFGQGLQMIALPYSYPDATLDALFNYTGVTLAVWDQSKQAYALTPNAPANEIDLGQGYWVRFPHAVSVVIPGTSAPSGAPFDIPLQAGWNMVGDPFPTTVPLSSLSFNKGLVTFAQATSASTMLIGATVWSYDNNSNSYVSAPSLRPNVGYWVFAYSATDMEVSE